MGFFFFEEIILKRSFFAVEMKFDVQLSFLQYAPTNSIEGLQIDKTCCSCFKSFVGIVGAFYGHINCLYNFILSNTISSSLC